MPPKQDRVYGADAIKPSAGGRKNRAITTGAGGKRWADFREGRDDAPDNFFLGQRRHTLRGMRGQSAHGLEFSRSGGREQEPEKVMGIKSRVDAHAGEEAEAISDDAEEAAKGEKRQESRRAAVYDAEE